MLESFLQTLCSELSLSNFRIEERGKRFSLPFTEEIEVILSDLKPGVAMSAILRPCPQKRKEDLFIYLMRANLLGQGTGGSRIGLDAQEKNLTLSLGLPYEMDYPAFKERFEEFVNHMIYWRKVLVVFEGEKPLNEKNDG